MRLILFHPGPAFLSCESCVKYVTDLDAGEVKEYMGVDPADGQRKLLPQVRPPGTLPPCHRCPKGSPEHAKEMELSRKNWKAFVFFLESREVGLTDEQRRDPIVRRNFGIIGRYVRARESMTGAMLQASEFARLFKRGQ